MFITGIANSLAEILSALQQACTDNGYALNGNVLSKGTLFVEVKVSGSNILIQGGTGQSGGVLSGRSSYSAGKFGVGVRTTSPTVDYPLTFPATYYIHLNSTPDEVYIFVNYSLNCYQYMCFGQSDQPGLLGTGNWYAATSNSTGADYAGWDFRTNGGGFNGSFNCGLFDNLDVYNTANGGVHTGLEAADDWSFSSSWLDRWTLQANSPSAWNGEAVLSPIIVYRPRAGGTYSPILQMRHIRWAALDNLTDGQVITIGPDKWKVYPLWRRGTVRTTSPTPSQGGTGFLGYAVRYDGA